MSKNTGATPPPAEKADASAENGASALPGPNATEMQPCPHCGGIIRADAVTCRHCKRDLHNPNAPQLVLDPSEWVTEVPEWMREVERKALARRLLLKKLRRNSWKIIGAALTPVLLVIVWRLFNMPEPPTVRVIPTNARRGGTATPSPSPKPAQPSPQAAPTAEPVAAPTPDAAPDPLPAVAASAPPPVAEPSPAPTPGAQPAYDISPEDLSQEYRAARAIADDRYTGQLIRLTGTVRSIDTAGNTPSLLLTTTGRPGVRCLLAGDGREALRRVRPGALVSVRGTVDSAFIEIIVSDCVIE